MKKLLVTSMVIVTVALCMMGVAGAGSLEPSGPPGSTMHDLNEIYGQINSVSQAVADKTVWKIHDLDFYDDWGSDPLRWAISNNDTPGDMSDDIVLDKETGLMWPRNANIASGRVVWNAAVNFCLNLTLGGRKGWRLPTVEELASLVDPYRSDPALPQYHPFLSVQSSNYWSSTTALSDPSDAWIVDMLIGDVDTNYKGSSMGVYLWPVRGGSNPTY